MYRPGNGPLGHSLIRPGAGRAAYTAAMTPMHDEGHGPADWAARLADALRARGGRLVSAESCTGGGVAAACTDLPGSSDWFERGLVTYSNAAKTELLGVPEALLAAHGAVSLPVARAMAEGAVGHGGASCSLAITGIAGPGGGSAKKPVGTVVFARAERDADPSNVVADLKEFGDLGRGGMFDGRVAGAERAPSLTQPVQPDVL